MEKMFVTALKDFKHTTP